MTQRPIQVQIVETPADRLRRIGLEARRAPQPDGWMSRVYESVTGLRWRCCGNEWGEEHSPWCEVVRDDTGSAW